MTRGLLIAAALALFGCGGGSSGGTSTHQPAPLDPMSLVTTWNAGNPGGHCGAGLPADAQPVDTSHPTTVVGTGTPASCTSAALGAAVAAGGIITFDCGAASTVVIPVTATLNVKIDRDTVIDGGRKVILDGRDEARILSFAGVDYQHNAHRLTLQHLAFVNGRAIPTEAIPAHPAPCSQGYNDGEGGAVYVRDGNLTVIDCIFASNHAAPLGPDTGGGAIYIAGSMNGAVIAGSTFRQNSGSNAAAVGALQSELRIYDSLFSGNTASGYGANNDDASQCSYMNNGQHEIGSGGNGGAIYSDGVSKNVLLCGDRVVGNAAGAGAYGGGLFFTSNDWNGTLTIADTVMTGNTGGHWTQVQTGSITNAGTAVGTNCRSISIQGSTLQGVP